MSKRASSEYVTGDKVKELREALNLSRSHFAPLVGVHVATVYRWEEAGTNAVRIEPFQLQLLAVIQDRVDAIAAPEKLGETILKALLTRGPLFGLYKLLESAFAATTETTRE